MELLHEIINWIVEIIKQMWYIWIFIWMFLESSFFPFPSEVIIIPAGYLAWEGKMNLFLVIFFWIAGSLVGAWFNYLLASKLGRRFLEKFINKDKLDKLDKFFEKHGHISTFNGRLIPVVRQYISFPAGLAKMNWWKFTIYTGLGAGIWVVILALLGYFIWNKQDLIKQYSMQITIAMLVFVLISSIVYYFYIRKRN